MTAISVLEQPDFVADGVDHTLQVLIDFLDAEAEHGDAELGEYRVPFRVFRGIVQRAIDLDGQFQRNAVVVRKEGADRVLAAERRTGGGSPEVRPELPFGF